MAGRFWFYVIAAVVVIAVLRWLWRKYASPAVWRLRQNYWSPVQRAKSRLWAVGAGVVLAFCGLWTWLGFAILSRLNQQIVPLVSPPGPAPDLRPALEKLAAAIETMGANRQQGSFQAPVVGLALILIFFGCVVWWIVSDSRKPLIPAALAAGAFLSVGKLVSFEKLLGFEKLVGFEAKLGEGGESETRISIDLSPAGLDLDCNDDYVVSGFIPGEHEKWDNKSGDLSQKAKEIGAKLRKLNESGRLAGVIFVGSADTQQMLPEALKKYGSNAGLAQARAQWVRTQLEVEGGYGRKIEPALVLSTGPSFVGLNVGKVERTKDRSVRVCAVWNSKR